MVNQRDIMEINFPVGEDEYKIHPAIIISNNFVFEQEEKYYGMMLSTKEYDIPTELTLSPYAFTHQTEITSIAKCHLIADIYPEDIIQKKGSLKIEAFDKLIEHMRNTTFGRGQS